MEQELQDCRELLLKVLKEDFDYKDIKAEIAKIDKVLKPHIYDQDKIIEAGLSAPHTC